MAAWLRNFGARHPLFVAALVGAACVSLARWEWLAGAAGVVVFSLGIGLSGAGKRGLACLMASGIAVGNFCWREGLREAAERELIQSSGGGMSGLLLKDAQGGGGYWTAPVRLQGGPHDGIRVWWEGRGDAPVAGARVRGTGSFLPLSGPRNPGEFDRSAWMRRQGIAAVFRAVGVSGSVETGPLAAWGATIRRGFRDRVTAGLDPDSREAGVIRAVVIGEQPPDADALIAAFRNSGTLHVFSVSGLHVAMVASIGWVFLGWLGMPRRRAVLLLLPLIFGYSWITGNSAPAVRSAWMAAVFLGAFVFRRKPDLLNALGAVLLAAMLWDGGLLFQPGVQLSYGVVAAIAVGTGWAARRFAWIDAQELYLPTQLMSRWQTAWLWLRKKIAQSLSVSLAAGIGSAPLTAFHFGLVTPVSVLAGLVLVPLVFVVLSAALVAVLLSPVAPLCHAVNRMNAGVARCCVGSAEMFSAIPGGHFQLRRDTREMLLVYDLEHGAGGACFSSGGNGAVLLDCGDRQGFRRTIAPSLRSMGIEPDAVVLSHPDGDHLGGGAAVWEAMPVRQVLAPVKLSRSPAYGSWMEDAPAAGISVRQAVEGETVPFPGGAVLEVLYVPDPLAKNALADQRVAVHRLHWRGWKILFTSDAGIGTENRMLRSGRDLKADLIIAGRNRDDLSLGDRFLDAVKPRAIIASNSAFPPEEQLPPGMAEYLRGRGIEVIDQAKSGGVTILPGEDGSLQIEGFLGPAPVILKRP